MAVPGDVAALEDFSREALGTVHLWCGPCKIKTLNCASATPTAASIAGPDFTIFSMYEMHRCCIADCHARGSAGSTTLARSRATLCWRMCPLKRLWKLLVRGFC